MTAILGLGLAQATTTPYGMVDPILSEQLTGYEIYIERCATCHVALPPALLPTQTWQTLVMDPAHYGVTLSVIDRFDQQLMLNYLQVYSRRHQGRGVLPYRLNDSTYFQALHPAVELPQPLNVRSCAGCHIGAPEQDYSGAFE
ncbi:MAG: cytochrome C [Cyanobacteria bacterium P01_F01_bin.53]